MLQICCVLVLLCCLSGTARAVPSLVLDPPVDGELLRGFDVAGRYSAGHRGVDWSAPVGTPVLAAADGVVSFAGKVAGRWSVSVDHGGIRTTYTPVKPSLPEGATVRSGDVLGTLLAGHCAEACLHFGVTDGRDYYDPVTLLRAAVVRLVPVGSAPVEPPSPPPLSASGARLPAAGKPVPGPVSSPFGMRLHPVLQVWELHDGTDFAAACGTPIRTPWAGTVTARDVTAGYGYRVHVTHADGLVTAYAHLPGFAVHVGQALQAGEVLGVVGTTGYSTGCHLHWMAWHHGALVDPLSIS